MRDHRRNDDQQDALNDYLDALGGTATTRSGQPDLEPDLRESVDRFLTLAGKAGMTSRPSEPTRRRSMNTLSAPIGAITPPQRTARPRVIIPRAWSQWAPALSTGALIIAAIALVFSAFGPNGLGRGGGNEPSGRFAAAPVATAAPDDLSTTRPRPGANECTVEPMTREEIVNHLEQANVATYQLHPHYEQTIKPTTEERDAILHTFNSWLACGLHTPITGPAYQLRFETPWMTANSLPVFYGFTESTNQRPISENELEAYADILVSNNSLAIANPEATPMYDGTPAASPYGTPEWAPLPADATPAPRAGGQAGPVLFADDILMTGPESASAQVVFVDEKTNAVQPGIAYTAHFVLVDGQWLLDNYILVGSRG